MLSLRRRALLGSLAAGLITVIVGVATLNSYVNNRVLARFDAALKDRHTQIVVALSGATQNADQLSDLIFDPSYDAPYSGNYWQIQNDRGETITSASLFDAVIDIPDHATHTLHTWNTKGPDGAGLRSMCQHITFEDGSKWMVTVAKGRSDLILEQQETRKSLLLVFSLVGMIGVSASLLTISSILMPLRKLRRDVATRWDNNEELTAEDYPEEVAPLVTDINDLMHRNRDIVKGARRQAADLAHALKTPSAILRNELDLLAFNGANTPMAIDALDRLDAQLGRSLARMRAANSAELTNTRTDLSNSIDRFHRLFKTMAERDGKTLQCRNVPGLRVRMDTQDIEEVIGNLLDNALKWCTKTVQLSTEHTRDGVTIRIEDDGPGIPEDNRREALKSGGRLDTSTPGTGLGLAIAVDLLKAYGAELSLNTSKTLGGLGVVVHIPGQLEAKAA